jgi:hypothetical protein
MADIEQDPRVAHLLNTASHEATRFIHPRGVQAVRATVRHRRRNTVAGTAALAATLLVGGPVAAMNLTGSHTQPSPPSSTSSSADPTPTSTPSPSPSQLPPSPKAPDAKISASALRSATLSIPAWPKKGFDAECPSGKVHFTGGESGMLKLEGAPVYADVDHDGMLETVSVVSCNPQGSDYKVLAFDRDAAGNIVTLGQVVASAGTAGHPGDILTVWSVQAGDSGQVRVDVGDYRPCCAQAQASQHQWRTYGWNGTAFTQTAGPTAFGPNPNVTDLRATTPGLTMTKQADGTWHGKLTVILHNAGGFATPGRVQLLIGVASNWQVTVSGCTLDKNSVQPVGCTLPALAKGADRTVTLTFKAPAGALDAQCQLWTSSINQDGAVYPNVNPDVDNSVKVPVTQT